LLPISLHFCLADIGSLRTLGWANGCPSGISMGSNHLRFGKCM
jgi:hypothetical protein